MVAISAGGTELTELNFTEAIKDSPYFRYEISRHEKYFDRAQKRLEETVKLLDVAGEMGNNYVSALYNLTASINGLWADLDIDGETEADRDATLVYKSISEALSQIVTLNKQLVESAHPPLRSALDSFVRVEVGKLNETRHHFSTLSASLSETLAKKAGINKAKTQELQDARDQLTAIGTCFAHNSLDYVSVINSMHAKKSPVLLEALWDYVSEFAEHHHKGHRYFKEKQCGAAGIREKIESLKTRAAQTEKRMHDDNVRLMPNEVLFQQPAGLPVADGVTMEGYLFKRATNAFKTWNRRWFMIREDKLLYSHKTLDGAPPTVMENNLKLCLVRPAPPTIERTCCFELVTPLRHHLLQADSEALCTAWIRALQRTIQHLHESDESFPSSRSSFVVVDKTTASQTHSAFYDRPPYYRMASGVESQEDSDDCRARPSTSQQSASPSSNRVGHLAGIANGNADELGSRSSLARSSRSSNSTSTIAHCSQKSGSRDTVRFVKELLSIDGNERCADCGCQDAKWTSINLGIVICIECSGAHRSLGSKVRSLMMDTLEPEQKNVLLQLGNRKVNSIFLAHLPGGATPIEPNATREDRERWIIDKYVERKFADPSGAKGLSEKPRSTSLSEMASYGITHYKPYFSHNGSSTPPAESSNEKTLRGRKYAEGGSRLSRSSFGSDSNLKPTTEHEEHIVERIESGSVEEVLRLMVGGLDLNSPLSGTYPLHLAVKNDQSTLVEFLLLNDARMCNLDDEENTALHNAAILGHTFQVCQLLRRDTLSAPLKNRSGKTPLELAEDGQFADIVTMLRLVELRSKEIADELSSSMDETVDAFISELSARHSAHSSAKKMPNNG